MKKYCDYCDGWIEYKYIVTFSGHRATCKKGPEREEWLKKVKKANKINGLNKITRRPYKLKCKRCSKKFVVEMTEYAFRNKKEPYREYCSYKCSNSHIQTSEQNEIRRRKSTKYGYEIRVCKFCEKNFKVKQNRKNVFCSKSCAGSFAGLTFLEGNHISESTIQWFSYKDIKVRGTYELRTCYILDAMKEVKDITNWEYTNDRFQYIDVKGNKKRYIVDFKIFNDKIEYIEVKGRIVDNDKNKWKAVRDAGHILKVWTLDKIIEYERKYGILTIWACSTTR